MDAHRLVDRMAHPVQKRLEPLGYLVVVRQRPGVSRATAFCRDRWERDVSVDAPTPDEALRLLEETVERHRREGKACRD